MVAHDVTVKPPSRAQEMDIHVDVTTGEVVKTEPANQKGGDEGGD